MAIISKNERKLPDLYSVAPISVNQGCPQVQPLSPPDFLSHNVRKTGIDALKDREDLNKKISLREGQMRSIKQLRYWPKGMFLSQIIEQILPLLCEDKAYYFQKKNKTSGSFVINLPEKLIYVFPDGPFIKHQFSAYAETRTAIALPLDSTQRGFTVAYRMSQTCYHTNGNVDVIKTTTLAKRFLNELAVIRSFDCFLQTRCEFCFTQVERGFSFDKICVIQDGYASGASFSLYNVSDKNRALIVSQLAAGLALLHRDGRIHGAVKPLSIVFRQESNGRFVFKWTDAGFSTTCIDFPQSHGFYGHLTSTPPEYLGETITNPALLIPGENWAAALCFLQLLNIPVVPWQQRIQSYFNTQRCVKPDQRDELIKEMIEEINHIKQKIAQLEPSNTREIFQACVDLLTIDPAPRITMPEVVQRMDLLNLLNQMGSTMGDSAFSSQDCLPIPQTVVDESKRSSFFKELARKMSGEQQLAEGVVEEENCPSISPAYISTGS